MTKDESYYMDVIDQIEAVRTKNNKNWMDLLRLAFRHAPQEAAEIVAEIYREDSAISDLAKRLTEAPSHYNPEDEKVAIWRA